MPLDLGSTPPLALVRFRRTPGADSEPGLLLDGTVHPIDLAAHGLGSLNDLLASWDAVLPALRADAASDTGLPLTEVVLAAPVEPRQVLQTGANYRQHVIDLDVAHRPADDPRTEEQARAEAAAMMDERAASGTPYVFIALPQTVVGPDEPLRLPSWSDRNDWELELAIVIGRRTFEVDEADALGAVWGWTIVDDVTSRDAVFRRDMPAIGTDWFRAKNSPGFNPTGPFAVPVSEVGPPFALRLDVNGDTMQDATTEDLLFDLPALIAAASRVLPLLPGDLLLTGSPAGNGQARGIFLAPGDELVGAISGLGVQRVRVAGAR